MGMVRSKKQSSSLTDIHEDEKKKGSASWHEGAAVRASTSMTFPNDRAEATPHEKRKSGSKKKEKGSTGAVSKSTGAGKLDTNPMVNTSGQLPAEDEPTAVHDSQEDRDKSITVSGGGSKTKAKKKSNAQRVGAEEDD